MVPLYYLGIVRNKPVLKMTTIQAYDVVEILNDDGIWRDYYTLRVRSEYNEFKRRFNPERYRFKVGGKRIRLDAETTWDNAETETHNLAGYCGGN